VNRAKLGAGARARRSSAPVVRLYSTGATYLVFAGISRWFLAGALVLACARGSEPIVQPDEVPEHLAKITAEWSAVTVRNTKAAFSDGRAAPKREVRWTPAERAELEASRSEARATIEAANADDRPWLLTSYVRTFAWYGIGNEWCDALLDISPTHPVWAGSGAWSLVHALEESADPMRVRAHVRRVAAVHDAPLVQAHFTYLQLEDADRAGEWERARQLHLRLQSIRVPDGESSTPGTLLFDPFDQLDPGRALRADTKVPNYCAPVIFGPHAGERVCLDGLFPFEKPTLILGWATWCRPCNEQLPRVIELVRERSLRVIAISHDDDAELAKAYLLEHGVEDWTVLLPRAERPEPRDSTSLDLRPIPFIALVDGEGNVEAGPPWLDAEALVDRLR
jgi:thiol-disulfide isomerase/thioredoxin